MRRWAMLLSAAVVIGAVVALLLPRETQPPTPAPVPTAPSPTTSIATPAAQPVRQQSAATASPTPAAFEFRHLLVNTNGDTPEACFQFSKSLAGSDVAHFTDYVRIAPALTPATRTTDTELCLAGLAFGTRYTVDLLAGLPAADGTKLAKDETVTVDFGDREPQVAIGGDGFILPRADSNGLTIQTVNVDRLKIHVLRIGDRLLPTQLSDLLGKTASYSPGGYLRRGTLSSRQAWSMMRDTASVVWTGTMDVARDHNRTVETAFPIAQAVKPGQNGAYIVVAEDAANAVSEEVFAPSADDSYFPYDRLQDHDLAARWLISTDLALTGISGSDGLHVFTRSLDTAKPLGGIKLSLLTQGLDSLGDMTTDQAGQVVFAPGLMRGKGVNTPTVIVAYSPAGDFTFLYLNRPAFDLSDRGVDGRPAPGPFEAFLYTDRGIYRPGETVEIMSLLRDHVGNAVETMPLTLVIRRPDGVEAQRINVPAQPQGGLLRPLSLSKTASLGLWSAEALSDPTGAPIGRVTFEVQDFVPQQLKVDLSVASTVLRPGQPVDMTIDGQFLYGAPAADLTAEGEIRFVRDDAPVPDAKGYRFGLVDVTVEDQTQTLTLPDADEAGQSHVSIPLDQPKQTAAPLKAIISAGLVEPSGRVVKDEKSVPIRSQPLLIGIKPLFADDRVGENQEAKFDIRVFDENGQPIARPGLSWQLIRENRIYDWFTVSGSWTWHYHVVDQLLQSGALDVGAAAAANVSQTVDWGSYRLVVSDAATKSVTSVRFQSGWYTAAAEADTPDKLDLSLDKPKFSAGDTVHLHVQGPFAGQAQLVIANDRVFETRLVDIPADGTTIDLTASADWGTGAYALVTMYRPLASGQSREPVRAMGVAWMPIDTSPRTLTVSIGTPDKITPRRKIDVPIKVAGQPGNGDTFVTLAAVDEGILQLTRFQTPDPAGFLFGKRRLGIDIRDDYGHLLDGSARAGTIREGGDEAIGGLGLPVQSTRTVSLFSGPVQLDADGNATVSLDIPDFEGQLRLMAVAYNGKAVGHGENTLIVRDPVVADLSLPRFLAPGDEARLALSLNNTDGSGGTYHVAVTGEGPIALSSDHPLDYPLAAGDHTRDAVAIRASDEGIGTVHLSLTGPNGFHVDRDWQIAVRAPHYPIALQQTALQKGGESVRVDPAQLAAFVPGSVTISVGYSAFAGIDVPSLLQSLYRYPYGCTEQLSSVAFPLIYFNDPALLGHATGDQTVHERVQQAIDTILDRQDGTGELGLWRAGDGEASGWLNVYALDFLSHAKDAGFTVPDSALQRSYAFVQRLLQSNASTDSGYRAQPAEVTKAYAAYVLARSGRADLGQLRRLHDTIASARQGGGMTPASVYWRKSDNSDLLAEPISLAQLAGALSLMGDHVRAKDSFALAIANLGMQKHPDWWRTYLYYSDTRDLAGLIAIAAETGDNQTAASLLERYGRTAPAISHLNTQEKAWLLVAAHALNKDGSDVALAVNGQPVSGLKLPAAFSPTVADVTAGYAVTNNGRDLWRTQVIQGAPKQAPSAMDAGYSLKKEFFDLDGNAIDASQLHQNDRIIVSLAGRVSNKQDHHSVVVDMLPAGWEIEAPIVNNKTYDFLGPMTRARVREARDDRFVAAFDIGPTFRGNNDDDDDDDVNDDNGPTLAADAFHLAYLARIVTPGQFTLPEAVVEDMYQPGFMGRTDAGNTVAETR